MDVAQVLKPQSNPKIPDFGPGDTVRVNFRIREGDRVRVQAFQGVVIRRQNGKGPAANFTVRRVASGGVGIERVFPLYSPLIDSLEVTRLGSVRRSKLYYLRGLQGRAARIKERTSPRTPRPEASVTVAEPEPIPEPEPALEPEEELVEETEMVAETEPAEATVAEDVEEESEEIAESTEESEDAIEEEPAAAAEEENPEEERS